MLRIGLTGGIAAGKSVVTRRFGDLGAVVVDSDVLARIAVEPGSDGLSEILGTFGPEVLTAEGTLDRPALGRLVFGDSAARERLNAIVHPRVRAGAARLIEQAPDDAVVVEDIPLLVETGQAARFHLVVVVDAPDDVRIERMVHERGMERSDAERRLAAQTSRAERLREADAVLVNDRQLDDLLTSTDALWHGRIVPFRDNLAAGRPATRSDAAAASAGLPGTSGLGRRVRNKLAAVLPVGASVTHDEDRHDDGRHDEDRHDDGGRDNGWPDNGRHDDGGPDSRDDDSTRAEVRVSTGAAEDLRTVSDAVTAAGFPRAQGAVEAGPGDWVVHRSADPALDVAVLVAAPPAPA